MFPQRLRRWLCSVVVAVVAVRNNSDFMENVDSTFEQIAMVAVVAAAVAVEAVGVMVILTMVGLVVVTMATVAGEATDGNCSPIDPFFRVAPYDRRLGSLGRLDARCAPPHTLRPQIVAVSIRVQ
jgi:hypothetical protein